jgi:hypothetical protein
MKQALPNSELVAVNDLRKGVDDILEHKVALLDNSNSAPPHGTPARDQAQDAPTNIIPIVAPQQVMEDLSAVLNTVNDKQKPSLVIREVMKATSTWLR